MQLLSSAKLIEGAVEYRLPPDPFSKFGPGLSARLFIYTAKCAGAVAMVRWAFENRIPYIPVDIKVPFERALLLFHSTTPKWVLVHLHTKFFEFIHAQYRTEIRWQENELVLIEIQGEQDTPHPAELAAVLFTSGSTGTPKGVMISNENIRCFTEWMVHEFAITARSRILSVSPLNFDLSVFEMFAVFSTGASLYFPPENGMVNPLMLAEYIFRNKVDVLYATPSWYRLLVSYGKLHRFDFGFVTTVLSAGEALDEKLVIKLQAVFPSAAMANLYGPTETNVCLYYRIPAGSVGLVRHGMLPVGNACPYIQAGLDTENVLEVSGDTVMLGYWPVLMKGNIYNTGDIMEYDAAEKVYYFVGRNDRMVKRNGYRIELAEIEACLGQLSGVIQVAVTCGGTGEKLKITAHVVSSGNFDSGKLREHCLAFLPVYMVPDVFKQHQNFPMTGTGKTDYRKLAEYGAQ